MTTMAERKKRRERKQKKEQMIKQKLAGIALILAGVAMVVLEHDYTVLATWSLFGVFMLFTREIFWGGEPK